MAQYWTYGLNDQGQPQLLGPYEDEGEAQDAGAELNRVQVVYAPTRDAAIRDLQRREQRGRRTEKPVEPQREARQQKGGKWEQDHRSFEQDLEDSLAEMDAEGAEL